MWHSALTFLFVPKYQFSTCAILALAHCSLIGAAVKLKHSEMSKRQTSRAVLQPKFSTALFLFYVLRLLTLFLLPSLGSLLPHQKWGGESSTKREGEKGKEGRGGEEAKPEHS